MTLTLKIINQQMLASDQEPCKIFAGSGTIGRAPGQDWVLHDASRYISSSHAHIHDEDGQFYITDASTNGVFVNGADQPLGRGNSTLLHDGDSLLMGDYEIAVAIITVAIDEPVQLLSSALGESEVPFLFDSGSTDSAALPPDEWAPEPPMPAPAPSQTGMFERLEMKTGMDSSPTLPPLDLSSSAPLFEPEVVQPIARPVSQSVSQPGADDESPVTAPPATVANESSAQPDVADIAALQALLKGAGLENSGLAVDDVPALMFAVGAMMRETVSGLMAVMRARSEIKSGFRTSATTRAVDNNPLEFCASPDEALGHLLGEPRAGDMLSLQAIREGLADVEAHQLAVMAGMQAALKAVIGRFDPALLQAQFDQQSPGGGFLAIQKRARSWAMFETHFKTLSDDLADDFQHLFGDAFAEAYEGQVQKIKQPPHG